MVDFKNAEELLALCSRNGQRISEVMKRRECDLGEVSMEQVCSRMQGVWEIMRQSALTPLHTPVKSVGGLIGGEAGKLKKHQSSGRGIRGEALGQAIAAATGEEAATIEDVYEPYLMQIGYLMRTPRGRTLTKAAYAHLGIQPAEAEDAQMKLFENGADV